VIREFILAPVLGLQVAATVIFSLGVRRYWPGPGAAWFSYVTPLFLAAHALWFGWPALMQVIKYHLQVIRGRRAHKAATRQGDGGFETEKNLEAAGHFNPNTGVPVGKLNGRPVFAQPTHFLVNAPAGTQKTVAAVIPALAHGFRIPGKNKNESTCASVIVADLKRELKAMTARLRAEVHGQRVIILDPSDPLSGSYNALDLVKDCLHGGGMPRGRAVTFADFVALCLEPEPGNDPKNKFWRAGARNLIVLCILWLCLLHKERATLPEVCRIIRDPAALESVLLECEKSEALGGELGVMARDALGQGKYLPEFRTGAALALKAFTEAGELANVTGASTFRWSECKRIPTTVYICANFPRHACSARGSSSWPNAR
jgi:type IV secretion system protein VirD4